MKTVAIVGLGLIGGSLGLALKEYLPEVEVLGVAPRPGTAEAAMTMGAVDRAGTDLALVNGADLVVLACPLAATAAVLEDCLPHLAEGARVTDVGSVKAAVVNHALSALDPDRNPFLGGHPMAGKEVSGIAHAEAGLFKGKSWILTPPQGDELQEGWVDYTAALRAIGALPVLLPPGKHDRYVAMISHLPFLLSAAYLLATGEEEEWGEASALASSGFRDISRLGAGDPAMYTAIAGFNRDEVLRSWGSLHRALDMFEAAMARGEEAALLELFRSAQGLRNAWASEHPEPT